MGHNSHLPALPLFMAMSGLTRQQGMELQARNHLDACATSLATRDTISISKFILKNGNNDELRAHARSTNGRHPCESNAIVLLLLLDGATTKQQGAATTA